MTVKIIFKWIIRDWWVVRKGAFPYPEGDLTYNIKKRMVLDIGLNKEEALFICTGLNYKQ